MDIRIIVLTIVIELVLFAIGVGLEIWDDHRLMHFND